MARVAEIRSLGAGAGAGGLQQERLGREMEKWSALFAAAKAVLSAAEGTTRSPIRAVNLPGGEKGKLRSWKMAKGYGREGENEKKT